MAIQADYLKNITIGQIFSFWGPATTIVAALTWGYYTFAEPALAETLERKIQEVTQEKFETINRNLNSNNDKLTAYNENNIRIQGDVESIKSLLEVQNNLLEALVKRDITTMNRN